MVPQQRACGNRVSGSLGELAIELIWLGVGSWPRFHRAGTGLDARITHLTQRLGLVFVAVYQKALHLSYVDGLLAKVNNAFSARYDPAKHRCGGARMGGCQG